MGRMQAYIARQDNKIAIQRAVESTKKTLPLDS